jgi:hypothetical protein
MEREALQEYVMLLADRDDPLQFDKRGQIVLRAGTIPKGPSERLRADAITINERLYVRDELLAKLPNLERIHEVTSDLLRVRTTTSLEHAQDAHAMCTQLLPELAMELGALPTRRLALFLFAARSDYEATLEALSMGARKLVAGVAMPNPLVAMVCMEALDPDIAQGVILHETTHLFSYAVSRSVLPAWYSEGLADTFGGTGTYTWNGTRLTTQGQFDRSRLDALKVRDGLMPLREFLEADQFVQWQRGNEYGLAFYAQSWAFLRFMRRGAGDALAAKFVDWETRCRGQALGFELGGASEDAHRAAAALFQRMFAEDLDKLERGFGEWLIRQ